MNENNARFILDHSWLMTLATADHEGVPRVSPVGYFRDEDHNFYWISSKDAVHSANIRQSARCDLVIIGKTEAGEFSGVYVSAQAAELVDESGINSAIALHKKLNGPKKWQVNDSNDVTGSATWRIYRATPQQMFIRDETTDSVSSQVITIRTEIDIQ